MAISLENRIPCKYLVARYVDDEIRNEPINIGIILQSQKNFETTYKFVPENHKIRTSDEDTSFLRTILQNIYREISYNHKADTLYKIADKYSGKIKFTDPRGTLAEDLEKEIETLYERYISIVHTHREISKRTEIITLSTLRKNVWSYIHESFKRHVRRNRFIDGKTSRFKYDFIFGENKKILHSISFDAVDSLKKTKLFDWHVMDAINRHGFKHDNFGAIISTPSEKNPRYQNIKEQFKQGQKILESKNYQLITYDKDTDWQKEIQDLV